MESVLGSNIAPAPPPTPHFFIFLILYNTFLYIVQYLLFLVHIPHTPHHPYPQHCVHIHPDPRPTNPPPPPDLTPSATDPPPPPPPPTGPPPPKFLYPRHLCRGVYSFRFSVRMFVCSFVRSYFLPSRGICVKVLR